MVKVERLKAIKAKLHGRRSDRVRPACEDIEKEPLRLSRKLFAGSCMDRSCGAGEGGAVASQGWNGKAGGGVAAQSCRLRIWAGSRKFAVILRHARIGSCPKCKGLSSSACAFGPFVACLCPSFEREMKVCPAWELCLAAWWLWAGEALAS